MKPIVPFHRLIAIICETFDNVSSNGDYKDGVALIRGLYSSVCEFRCAYRAKLASDRSSCVPLVDDERVDDIPF